MDTFKAVIECFLVVTLVSGGYFFHAPSYASNCDMHNSAISNLGHAAFVANRILVGPKTDLTEHERKALKAAVSLSQANGALLSDCQTVVTAAHVALRKEDGKLYKGADYVDHQGDVSDRSEVKEILEAGPGFDWPQPKNMSFFLYYDDWMALRLEEKKENCGGIEPAYVSRERLEKLAEEGKLFSVTLEPPTGGFSAPSEDGRRTVDFLQNVIRNVQLVDGNKLKKAPHPDDFKDMLWHTGYGKMNDSGHMNVAIIEGQIYLVGTFRGEGQQVCVDKSHENRAYGCPAESLWITDENAYGKAIIKAMRQSNPNWKMKRFL